MKKLIYILIGCVLIAGIVLVVWKMWPANNSALPQSQAEAQIESEAQKKAIALYTQLDALDSDGDGLSDFQELQLGRNPKKADFSYTGADADRDGVTDAVENWFGTDPQMYDTDKDGQGDLYAFEQIQFGEGLDTDKDGLPDYAETKWYGTDPKNPDTDGDTYQDGAEVLGGYNPKGEGKL